MQIASNVRNGSIAVRQLWVEREPCRWHVVVMALVLLHTFQTSMEAGLARSRLGAEGIQAFVFDTDGGWDNSGGFGMPVRLMVSEEDAQTAASILTDALDGGFTIEGED